MVLGGAPVSSTVVLMENVCGLPPRSVNVHDTFELSAGTGVAVPAGTAVVAVVAAVAVAGEAAERWTKLAMALHEASESDEPRFDLWSRIGDEAAGVLDAEERLWTALGER